MASVNWCQLVHNQTAAVVMCEGVAVPMVLTLPVPEAVFGRPPVLHVSLAYDALELC